MGGGEGRRREGNFPITTLSKEREISQKKKRGGEKRRVLLERTLNYPNG